MSVYKKFSPLDFNKTPFNAHKQYNFNSSSALSNKIEIFSTKWTSQSVDGFNSGNIKYQQLDHLFYRNYKNNVDNKFGDINYLKEQRTLYENATILSIPSGLYGHQIKPGSFNLFSNGINIIDDSYGNLIKSGTLYEEEYCVDPRSIILNIDSLVRSFSGLVNLSFG